MLQKYIFQIITLASIFFNLAYAAGPNLDPKNELAHIVNTIRSRPYDKENDGCGGPILKAYTQKTQFSSQELNEGLAEISKKNLAKVQESLKDFDKDEKIIMEKIKKFAPNIITRQEFSNFLKSYSEKSLRSRKITGNTTGFFCPAEDLLFASPSCVFASIGPTKGKPMYGKVILKYDSKNIPEFFATSKTGYSFLRKEKHYVDNLSFQNESEEERDRLIREYTAAMATNANYLEALGFMTIKALRSGISYTTFPIAEPQKIKDKLVHANSKEELWKILGGDDMNPLAAFEAHFDLTVSFDHIEAIYIPDEYYFEPTYNALFRDDPKVIPYSQWQES